MKQDTIRWCQSCVKCARRKRPAPRQAPQRPIYDYMNPFDLLGIDVLTLTRTENGNLYVLVVTDYATRWVEAFAMEDQKAETIAKILINEIICRHGAPKVLLSDQGANFLSKVVEEVCRFFEIKKINTTAYHPQTNGLTERFNKICDMLTAYCDLHQADWDIYLPMCLFAHRVSEQASAKETPFKLLYGRTPNLPSDIEDFTVKSSFTENLKYAWRMAKSNIARVAERDKNAHDFKYKSIEFKVGDWVRKHDPVCPVGLKNKLKIDQWVGPFKVVAVDNENVSVDNGKEIKKIHPNRLKMAEPPRISAVERERLELEKVKERNKENWTETTLIEDIKDNQAVAAKDEISNSDDEYEDLVSEESEEPKRVEENHDFEDFVESSSDEQERRKCRIDARRFRTTQDEFYSDEWESEGSIPSERRYRETKEYREENEKNYQEHKLRMAAFRGDKEDKEKLETWIKKYRKEKGKVKEKVKESSESYEFYSEEEEPKTTTRAGRLSKKPERLGIGRTK